MSILFGSKEVNGVSYKTVVVEGHEYIHASVITSGTVVPKDLNAFSKLAAKVNYLLGVGSELSSIRPCDIPEVKVSTAWTYLSCLKRIALDKESVMNAKRTIKRVNDSGCSLLVSKLLR